MRILVYWRWRTTRRRTARNCGNTPCRRPTRRTASRRSASSTTTAANARRLRRAEEPGPRSHEGAPAWPLGRAGFTTQDMHRSQVAARAVALVYNWWCWYVRAANPQARREALTSRPLLLAAVGRATSSGNQTTLQLTPMHAEAGLIKSMIAHVHAVIRHVRAAAAQLPELDRWRSLLAARRDPSALTISSPAHPGSPAKPRRWPRRAARPRGRRCPPSPASQFASTIKRNVLHKYQSAARASRGRTFALWSAIYGVPLVFRHDQPQPALGHLAFWNFHSPVPQRLTKSKSFDKPLCQSIPEVPREQQVVGAHALLRRQRRKGSCSLRIQGRCSNVSAPRAAVRRQ